MLIELKRWILICIAGCVSALFFCSSAAFAATDSEPVDSGINRENLMVNGSFESGHLQGWAKFGWGPKKTEAVSLSKEKGGGGVVKIISNGVSWHFIGQKLRLKNNKTYRLSFRAKTDGVVAGTVEVRGVKPGSDSPWRAENRLIFREREDFNFPRWKSYSLEFSVPDALEAQETVYILFGTSSWKKEGAFVLYDDVVLEELTTEEGKKETRLRSSNLLLNGGFEFGLADWIPAKNCSFVERGVRLSDEAPYEGRFCLEADNEDVRYPFDDTPAASGGHFLSNWAYAKAGHMYYFTVAMRGSRDGQRAWFRFGDGRVMEPSWKSAKTLVHLTQEWQVFTFKQKVPPDASIKKLVVEIHVDPGEKFWLDAVRLTEDAPADEFARADDQVGVSVKLGRFPAVYSYGENVEIILEAVNAGTQHQDLTVEYDIKDLFGTTCGQGNFTAALDGGTVKQESLKADTLRRGRFDLHTRVLDHQGRLIREKTTPFVVMKPVAVNAASPIAMNAASTPQRGRTLDDNYRLLGTYGYSWIRQWFAWKFAEPFDGGAERDFDWSEFDRLVDSARDHQLNIMGMLTVSWEPKNRTTFRTDQFYGPGYHHKKSRFPTNRNFDRWSRFVNASVERYADKIDVWEIQNEPDMYPPENLAWYNALVAATYPVIKVADPVSQVVACSPGDSGAKAVWNSHLYIEDFLKNGGVNFCDLIGLHPYTGTASPIWADLQGTLDQIQAWIQQSGGTQTVVMTEAGNYNTIGGYNLDGNNLSQASRQAQCWLIAWANKTRHFQHASAPNLNSRRSCYDPVLIPNATFCAANSLAELFNASDYDSCRWIEMPQGLTGIYGFQFVQGDDLILALWSAGLPEKRVLRLSDFAGDVSVTDLMGNSVVLKSQEGKSDVLVSSILIYIRIQGAARMSASEYLQQAEALENVESNGAQRNRIGSVSPGEIHAVGYIPPAAGPFEVTGDGFIKDWLFIGPFANPGERGQSVGFNFDFLESIGGESSIRLRPEMSVFYEFPKQFVIPRREVKAVPCHSPTDYVNLKKALSPAVKVVNYAYVQLSVPTTTKGTLCVGSDDGIKAWLNGKEVISNRTYRGASPDQDRAEIILKKGMNRLMLKVDTDDGGWGFYCRVLDEAGMPLTNMNVGW